MSISKVQNLNLKSVNAYNLKVAQWNASAIAYNANLTVYYGAFAVYNASLYAYLQNRQTYLAQVTSYNNEIDVHNAAVTLYNTVLLPAYQAQVIAYNAALAKYESGIKLYNSKQILYVAGFRTSVPLPSLTETSAPVLTTDPPAISPSQSTFIVAAPSRRVSSIPSSPSPSVGRRFNAGCEVKVNWGIAVFVSLVTVAFV